MKAKAQESAIVKRALAMLHGGPKTEQAERKDPATMAEDDPIVTAGQWYPHFRDFHHRVIAETPDFDYEWVRVKRPDVHQEIKSLENQIDALGEAKLSQVMAIIRQWRELVLKAEFERRKAEKKEAYA